MACLSRRAPPPPRGRGGPGAAAARSRRGAVGDAGRGHGRTGRRRGRDVPGRRGVASGRGGHAGGGGRFRADAVRRARGVRGVHTDRGRAGGRGRRGRRRPAPRARRRHGVHGPRTGRRAAHLRGLPDAELLRAGREGRPDHGAGGPAGAARSLASVRARGPGHHQDHRRHDDRADAAGRCVRLPRGAAAGAPVSGRLRLARTPCPEEFAPAPGRLPPTPGPAGRGAVRCGPGPAAGRGPLSPAAPTPP